MNVKKMCAIALVLFSSGLVAEEVDAMSITARFDYVGKLITESSGAKEVKSSKVPEAMSALDEAVALYDKAKGETDPEAIEGLLANATRKMFEAIRLSKSDQVTEGKKKRDYANRKKSIEALLAALDRVAAEKNLKEEGDQVKSQVAQSMTHADALFDKQEYEGAKVLLDQAYQHVKTEIESLRGGDTLVRTLNFASKEEEYHYELDRNNTHMMLLSVLTKDKKLSATMAERIEKLLTEAKTFRDKAEKSADNSEYEKAIENLERSTKSVVKAIRGAGVYIPG